LATTREKFRQYKFSHSLCQVLFCLCSVQLVKDRRTYFFCLLSYSSIRCAVARPLLRRMRFMVTSVLRCSSNSRKNAQFIHMHHLGQRGSTDFEFEDCLFSAVMKNFDHSLPCFSAGGDILRLFGKIYVNSFSIRSQLQQILCVLGMYALFDAHETSHCSFSVFQVLCTNWRFLLRYS